jgi:putative secretion ATPase (PEP-CTERM system associated)
MYETYYKFTGKPFRLSPDPRFFFSSQSHKRAMSYLLYGIKQGEGFIVITGDVGTGKSTLVGALCALLKDQNVITAKVVTTQLEAEDLLRITAAEFGLPYADVSKGVLLKSIELFLRDCAQRGKRAILLVDEAQNLPPRSVEELRMLSNFQIGGTPLLQSFLLGQKEFKRIIRSPAFVQLRQRVIAAYHLRPLEPDEIKGYIEHRLRLVNWKQDPLLTDDAFEELHRLTDGIPRRLNVFCDRLFLYSYLEQLHVISGDVIKAVHVDFQEDDVGAESSDKADQASDDEVNLHSAGGLESNRLAALEASLESLSKAMRNELRSLRQTLAQTEDRIEPTSVKDVRTDSNTTKLKGV